MMRTGRNAMRSAGIDGSLAHPRGFEPLTSAFGGQRSAILLLLLKQLYHRKHPENLAYRMSDMKLVIAFDA